MKVKKKQTGKKEYKVLIGANFGKDSRRIEKGEVINDLPAKVAKTLLSANAIKEVKED